MPARVSLPPSKRGQDVPVSRTGDERRAVRAAGRGILWSERSVERAATSRGICLK